MTSMKTIVALNGKGGVGKSTFLTQLAAMATMSGHGRRQTAIIDADPQCTVVDWGHNREAFIAKNASRAIRPIDIYAPAPHAETPGQIDYADFEKIYAKCAREGFDWCFVDTKGLSDVQANQIAVLADVIIVPCGPDEPEWSKLPNVANLVEDARAHAGRPIEAFVVLNKIHPSTGLDSVARLAAVAATSGLATAPGRICRRQAVPDSYSAGLCVEELATDSAGTGEWCRLFDFMATALEATDQPAPLRKSA